MRELRMAMLISGCLSKAPRQRAVPASFAKSLGSLRQVLRRLRRVPEAVWETTIGMDAAIEILIIVLRSPGGRSS